MFFYRAADLQRAFHRCFRSIVKDQRHAVAGRNRNQAAGCFSGAELFGAADDPIQSLEQAALLVNQKVRVTNNVYEQDMRDLELNFFLNLSGHLVTRPLQRQSNSIIRFASIVDI